MCYMALIPAAFAMFGAMGNSQAAKGKEEYDQKVAENNASISDYQSRDAARRGQMAAEDHMQSAAQTKSQQVVNLAARGLDISQGSALALLQDTDFMANQDLKRINDNVARERWGIDLQTSNFRETARMHGKAADNINPLMDGLMAGGKAFMGAGGFGSGGTVSDANGSGFMSTKRYRPLDDVSGMSYDFG